MNKAQLTELLDSAKINNKDVQKAIKTAHPSFKPFFNAITINQVKS